MTQELKWAQRTVARLPGRVQGSKGPLMDPFKEKAADHLADEVAVLIARNVISSRSPVADALLDYREDSVRTERSDRITSLEFRIEELVAALELVEWEPHGETGYCYYCVRPKYQGHSSDCRIGQALRRVPV